MLNKKTIILIIIIVLAVGAGTLWYVNRNAKELARGDNNKEKIEKREKEAKKQDVVARNNNEQESDGQEAEKTAVEAGDISTSTDEIDTSDWQTYRNEEYGFEVKYPEGWIVNNPSDIYKNYPISESQSKTLLRIENHKIEGYILKGDFNIGIGVYKSNKSLNTWFRSRKNYKTDKEEINYIVSYMKKSDPTFKKEDVIKKTKYDNLNGKIFTFISCKKTCSSEGGPYTNKELYLKKGGFIYYISITFSTENYNKYLPVAEKIISTFKVR